jgi:hypothetical protein
MDRVQPALDKTPWRDIRDAWEFLGRLSDYQLLKRIVRTGSAIRTATSGATLRFMDRWVHAQVTHLKVMILKLFSNDVSVAGIR